MFRWVGSSIIESVVIFHDASHCDAFISEWNAGCAVYTQITPVISHCKKSKLVRKYIAFRQAFYPEYVVVSDKKKRAVLDELKFVLDGLMKMTAPPKVIRMVVPEADEMIRDVPVSINTGTWPILHFFLRIRIHNLNKFSIINAC
jgi:hypothetical protein